MKKLLPAIALAVGLAAGYAAGVPTQMELDESAKSFCSEVGGRWTAEAQCDLQILTPSIVSTKAVPIDESGEEAAAVIEDLGLELRYVPDWMFHHHPMNLTVS